MSDNLNPAPKAKDPSPGDYGVCEHCGGDVDEHGVSKMLAVAETKMNEEMPDDTDQHAKGDQLHEAAFVKAIKKGG